MDGRDKSNKYVEGEKLNKIRVIFLGNQKVGKTSLIMRYMNHYFRSDYFPTNEIMYTHVYLAFTKT
jgi:GTPase SAR1 family protein